MECEIIYVLLNTISVSIHLDVDINDFYNNNGQATFVDKMCSFLGISFDRLKVANIRSGSAFVDYNVISSIANTTNSSD